VREFRGKQMMPYMILKHLGHKTVDTAADVRKKHENVGAIVLCGERAFDGVDLPANAFDAGNELLLFFVDMRHNLLAYPRGVWYERKGESFHSRRRKRTLYEHKFRTRAS
jgi:hypothetical protein